jgi:hypothetical protein
MSGIILPEYTLQVEFLRLGEHGLFCQMFVGKRDGTKVASTPPQPAVLEVCLELLSDMAKFHEIPEHERIGLAIQLETLFRQYAEEGRKRVVVTDPLTTEIVGIASDLFTATLKHEPKK